MDYEELVETALWWCWAAVDCLIAGDEAGKQFAVEEARRFFRQAGVTNVWITDQPQYAQAA